jgi:Flp pilus assembly protein TadB
MTEIMEVEKVRQLSILSFFMLVIGSFLLLRLSLFEFLEGILKLLKKKQKRKTIKDKVLQAENKNRLKGIKLLIDESKDILEATGKKGKFNFVCMISLMLFAAGITFPILIDNLFLAPVLAVGFSLLPFWYIKFTATFYKKHLSTELETALSVVTSSYIRSESILTAIDENITYMNPPVKEIFKSFLNQAKAINANIKIPLANMKKQINNDVFHEWMDAVIACQDDKTLKSTLTPIVIKLSDMRIVSAELDYLMYEPMKEFITMAIMLVGIIPIMYLANREWFKALVFTIPGKIMLALSALVIFISLAAVVRITKPIEYKR